MKREGAFVALALLLATLAVAWVLSRGKAAGPLFTDVRGIVAEGRPSGEMARLGKAPDFSLRRSEGGTLATADLRGKIWVADFIFTHCAAECPMMTTRLTALQAAIPAELPVRFVSISVDPDRDTPEILAEYAERNGADRNRWFFATGPFPEIRRIAEEGFHLGVGTPEEAAAASEEAAGEKKEEETGGGKAAGAAGSTGRPGDDFQILHSSRFVLVDREGEIRGYYDGTDADAVERLRKDILALAGEGKRP
jgi:protein SCO1/2